MILQIVCKTHNSRVIPAGDEWHFISKEDGSYEFDWADVYCTFDQSTATTTSHEFVGTITDQDGNWLCYFGDSAFDDSAK